MKNKPKSGGIPFDEIRLKFLKDPKQAIYSIKLAIKEYEKDNNMDILLDTLRLVIQAQS
jgi:hypothetical protein